MKSKRALIMIGIFAFLILGAGYVFAQGTCLSYVDRIPGITLADAQKAKLGAKEADFRKKMIQLRADHAVARVDKDEALKNKNFKKDDVQKQIRKIMDIETEMEITRLNAMDELRTVLTDEQWALFANHMDKKRPFKGKQCPGMGDDTNCPAGYGKGTGKGMGHGQGETYGKGMQNCPYSTKAATP